MDDNQNPGYPNVDRLSQNTGSSSLYGKNINQSRAQSQLSRNTGMSDNQFNNDTGSARSSGIRKEDLFGIGTDQHTSPNNPRRNDAEDGLLGNDQQFAGDIDIKT